MSKFWKKALAIFAVIAMSLFVFAACTPDNPDNPDNPVDPEDPPTQQQINLENLTKFGVILSESLGQNPNEGFYVDFNASLGFEFAQESKRRDDWAYDVSFKAGVFINDTEAVALEIKDKKASADQVAAGEDVVLGLYNTSDGNLYLQIRKIKDGAATFHRYNFSEARISTAIKSILLANGIDLDFVIREVTVIAGENGKPDTSLGEILSTAMGMIASVCDKVEIQGNDYIVTTSYKKIYGFVNGLVNLIPGVGENETLDTLLPDEVKNKLPEDISLNITFKTDGKILTGVKLTDSFLDMKGGENDGTFNFDANFSVAKTVPESFDPDAIVAANAELAAVEATKVLNLDAGGKIELQQKPKPDPENPGAEDGDPTVVRNLSWSFKANVDVLKLVEKNIQLTDPALEDNFLWFKLCLDGVPMIDLVWAPGQLGTTDLNLILDAPTVVKLAAGSSLGDFAMYLLKALYPDYLLLPITDTSLLGLINGNVGAIPDGTGSGEGGGETPDPSPAFNLKGTIDMITKAVKEIAVDKEKNEMRINIQNLFTIFGLDDSTKGTINEIIGGADVARFFESTATFGDPAMNDYTSLQEDLLIKTGTEKRAFSKTNSNRPNGLSAILEKSMVMNEGYLAIYGEKTADPVYDAKTQLLTVNDLNAMIGTGYIRYTGTDIEGNTWNSTASYGSNKTYYLQSKIMGYTGVDTSIVNEPQEITVYTQAVDPLGYFAYVANLVKGVAKFDLDLAFNSFKAKIVLGEIDSVDVTLTDPNASGANVEEKVYKVSDVFDGKLNVQATVNFKPSELYPTGSAALSRTVEYGAGDSLKEENLAYIKNVNTEYLKNSDDKNVIASQSDFTIEGVAFGKTFIKTVRVAALASIAIQAKGDGAKVAFSVGDKPGDASQYVRFEYTYEDGTVVKDIKPFDAAASDAVWANAEEMLDEKGALKASGTLNMNVTFNDEVKTIGIPVVSSLKASYSGSLTATEPADGFYTVGGKVWLRGADFPAGADRKLKVVVKVFGFPELTGTGYRAKLVLNEIENTVFTCADVVEGYYTLPEGFNVAGKNLIFTVSNIPEASDNVAIQISFVYESGIKTQTVADTGIIYVKEQLKKVGTAAFPAGDQLSGVVANQTRFVLTLPGESYYYLVWENDTYSYRFKNSSDATRYVSANVFFTDDTGRIAQGMNQFGEIMETAKGTFYVSYGYTASADTMVSFDVDFSTYTVKTKPTKTEYTVGEDFDKTGLAVTIKANGKETALVEGTDYTLDASAYKKDTAGTYTIKIMKGEKTLASFTVKVSPAIPTLSLNTDEVNLTVAPGTDFDPTGLIVTLTENGQTRTLEASEYEIDSSAYNKDTAQSMDQCDIIVKLKSDPTVTAKFTITVFQF